MQHTTVLNASACADVNFVHITPQNGAGPNRCILTDRDSADHNGGLIMFGTWGAIMGPLVVRLAMETLVIIQEDDGDPPASPDATS